MKKHKGNLSISTIFLNVFLTTIVAISLLFYIKVQEHENQITSLYKNDYLSMKSIEFAKLNFYYGIEEAYVKSKNGNDFFKYFISNDTEVIKNILDLKYKSESSIRIKIP